MRVELHCHSTHSDGSLSAGDVARAALSRGVRLFCLTDHDTLAGYEVSRDLLPGVRVLRGLELSCREYGRTVHLLFYDVEDGPGLETLTRRLGRVMDDRRRRIEAIVARLRELGVSLDADAILEGARGRTPGRPDVAKALYAAGAVNSLRDAFHRYLRDGGPADVPLDRLDVGEGLALARACGARVSLAHPHTLGSPSLVRDLFVRHRAHGLTGIEARYGRYAQVERLPWLRLADELGLVVTGGSDFHGDLMPDVTLPVIDLPSPDARRLCEWLGVAA